MITAIYDCRSKQEYIYRTNKIREISGASLLLSHVYEMFIAEVLKHGIRIKNTWKDDVKNEILFSPEKFEKSDYDGEVIYEGGGNLNIIYKNRNIYIRANRIFSKMLLDKTYSISIVASCTETTDNFNYDRQVLYCEKNRLKNQGSFSVPCSVLPVTQTDRTTFMPICYKTYENGKLTERTAEATHKRNAYRKYYDTDNELNTENLDSLLLKKGDSSILAVIYIDGNDMGNKIKICTENKDDYPQCINALRKFSLNTDRCFVEEPVRAIEECLLKKNADGSSHRYRRIIGGGDEITIICRAEDALDIITAYFESLEKTVPVAEGTSNASCAGISFFHSHMPFANVYDIAESCCESGKKQTRNGHSDESYIDFHYCHSGITNNLETLRAEQEEQYTNRPYRTDQFNEFIRAGKILREIGRSNVKSLGEAIVRGNSYYHFETERIKSKFKGGFTGLINEYKNNEDYLKRMIYDISVVYDLWFSGGENNVQTEN